jgi:hypothetical protein
MLVLAILNGTLRDLWYRKFINEVTAHQISSVTLLLLLGVYIWQVIQRFFPGSETQALFIGLIWLGLTFFFEFGFGMYRGDSLNKLFEDYNLLNGRLWVLVLIFIAIAPWLFYKFFKSAAI